MTWRDAPVVIDARAAVRREIGGVERVTLEMAARLPLLRPDRYSVMRPQQMFAHRAGHLWEQAVLPVAARRARILYCPANLAPGASRRNVVVIHDLAPLRHPGWYSTTFTSYQRHLLPLLANRARRVITPSEFSRQELAEGLELDPERVSVVPNGVDERFSPDADPEPVRRALGLDEPYVLVVGTRIARKNFSALAEARRRLRELGINLVAAGSGRAYMRPGEAPPMQGLGYVQERHLPGLYAGALALAMPSLYEGFGLPVLEAMASGVPVVAANRAALPETCGGAALLVDPEDGAGLAEALAIAATDEGLRERLIPAGLERASQFSWTRSAELTDAAIGEVLEADAYGMGPMPRRRTSARTRRATDVAVSTIVVNHERRDLLKSCLRSLETAMERVDEKAELLVVDNGSADGSVELVREHFPDVRLVELKRNEGFAGGLAKGIEAARGEWVAVFNNDTTVEPDALAVMLAAGASDPAVGSVAAQMRFADRRDVLNSAGFELDRLGIAADRLVGQRVSDHQEHEPYEVFGATGGAAIFRSEMLDRGRRLRRDVLRFLRGRGPGLARPRRTAGARCMRPAPWSTTTTRRPRATALRRSSTWSGATACGPWPRTRPAACCCATRSAWCSTTPATWPSPRSRARTLAPFKGRLQGLREWGRTAAAARHTGARSSSTARSAFAGRCAATAPGTRGPGQRQPVTAAPEPPATAQPSPPISMRSAIAHDWFQGFHGAERTVAAMLDVFERDPDVFTFQAARELLPDAAGAGHSGRVARREAARDPPARPRPRALALAAALHAALLRASGPERLRGGDQLLPRLRGRGPAARERAAPLLLLHADALRLDARRRARPGQRREGDRADHAARPPAGLGPPRRAAAGRVPGHLVRGRRARPALLRPRGPGGRPARRHRRLPPRQRARPAALLWVHRLVPYKRPLEVAAAFRELPGLRLTMVGVGPLEAGAARRPAAQRGAPGVAPARAAGRAVRVGARASSTSARRTSGSPWSRPWPRGRRWWPPTAAAPATSCARARTACWCPIPARPAAIAAGVRELAERDWDADELRRSAERFSESRFRERLGEVLRAHGAR